MQCFSVAGIERENIFQAPDSLLWSAHLAQQERGITLEEFKRDLRRSITVEKVQNKEITSKINISDSDITNYYNQHKAEFNLIVPQLLHLT